MVAALKRKTKCFSFTFPCQLSSHTPASYHANITGFPGTNSYFLAVVRWQCILHLICLLCKPEFVEFMSSWWIFFSKNTELSKIQTQCETSHWSRYMCCHFFLTTHLVSLVLYALNKLYINKDTLGFSCIYEGVATANKFSYLICHRL